MHTQRTHYWLGRFAAAVLFFSILLLLPRSGPAAALTVAPTGPTEIISAGGDHTCALTPAGAVDCWGDDIAGQAGGAAEHPGPYTQLSAGDYHTCALTPAGAADCWGWDAYGQAGGAAEHPGPYSQLSAGYGYTCALTSAGAVECWGDNDAGQAGGVAEHPGPFSQLSAGGYHTCALTPGGAADCWGRDVEGQAGGAAEHPGPYTQLSAGGYHTCALTPAGAADCWGLDSDGQAGGAAEHPGPYTQLSAGGYHTCALTPAGAVECWGRDAADQAGGAAEHPGPYTQLSAGLFHTCALTPPGAPDCWGYDGYGQVGGAAEHPGPYGPYRPPTLKIVKAVAGSGAPADWSFAFMGDLGDFSLTDDYPDVTDAEVVPGAVAVSESNPAGYATSVACDNGDSSTNGDLSLTLAAGDDVSCTFTNTICQPGSYDTAAGWACVDAAAGYFVDTVGASSPTACPAGMTSPPASDSVDDCTSLYPDIYVSPATAGTTGDGLSYGAEDIILWDGEEWTKAFDGSDAGLAPSGKWKHNINAFWRDDAGDVWIMSFAQNARLVPGISPAKVDGMDLVRYDGFGFSLYFDGNDVGLTNKTQEKIDALHVLPGAESPIGGSACQAYLLISTQGPGKVTNYSGGTLKFSGEDVLGFCATNLGEATAGLWHMVLDGSTQGMPKNSTDSISLSADGNTLYLTTRGIFNMDSASGGHSAVYAYDIATQSFSGPVFMALANGLPAKVDGLQYEVTP